VAYLFDLEPEVLFYKTVVVIVDFNHVVFVKIDSSVINFDVAVIVDNNHVVVAGDAEAPAENETNLSF